VDRAPTWRYCLAVLEELTGSRALRLDVPAVPWQRLPWQRLGRWLALALGAIALLYWNWPLVLATAAGIATLLAAYLLPTQSGRQWQAQLRQTWRGIPRHMTLAALSSGAVASLTYLAIALWTTLENRWLAAGAILQGVVTLLTLGLLGWQVFGATPNRQAAIATERYLRDLTAADPLARLIAVRALTRHALRQDRGECQQIGEYFCVMLPRESDPLVRAALLDSLHGLDLAPPPPAPPLALAPRAKRRVAPEAIPETVGELAD